MFFCGFESVFGTGEAPISVFMSVKTVAGVYVCVCVCVCMYVCMYVYKYGCESTFESSE